MDLTIAQAYDFFENTKILRRNGSGLKRLLEFYHFLSLQLMQEKSWKPTTLLRHSQKTRQRQNHVFLDIAKCCFFHRVFLNLAVSQPSRSSRSSLLENRVKNRVKRDFTRFLTSLNAVFFVVFFRQFPCPFVLSPKNRVNSKITCFLSTAKSRIFFNLAFSHKPSKTLTLTVFYRHSTGWNPLSLTVLCAA